jgi:AraC-like DNA-binding protein
VLVVGGDERAADAVRSIGLPARRLHTGDDLTAILEDSRPAAVAWSVAENRPEEWSVIRHLHDHPLLRRIPFLLYGEVAARDLDEAITVLRPEELTGSVVIADPDPEVRATYRRIVARSCPGHVVIDASDGTSALRTLGQDVPSLVIVSQTLPDMDGYDVLDRLHGDARGTAVPALVLGGRTITTDDVARTEPYARAMLLGRDILSEAEMAALLTRLLEARNALPQRTSLLVKHAIAYLHQHYHHPITRRQVAKAAGMSEDYLSRMFHRALRISPWDYLNRLRIQRAKERLLDSDDSIQVVARRVGFHDRAYFSRIFRKLTGVPPQAYRAAIRVEAESVSRQALTV